MRRFILFCLFVLCLCAPAAAQRVSRQTTIQRSRQRGRQPAALLNVQAVQARHHQPAFRAPAVRLVQPQAVLGIGGYGYALPLRFSQPQFQAVRQPQFRGFCPVTGRPIYQ